MCVSYTYGCYYNCFLAGYFLADVIWCRIQFYLYSIYNSCDCLWELYRGGDEKSHSHFCALAITQLHTFHTLI